MYDFKPVEFRGSALDDLRAKFADAVYVLHCFQNRTQKTSKVDLDLAKSRYRNLVQDLRQGWSRPPNASCRIMLAPVRIFPFFIKYLPDSP